LAPSGDVRGWGRGGGKSKPPATGGEKERSERGGENQPSFQGKIMILGQMGGEKGQKSEPLFPAGRGGGVSDKGRAIPIEGKKTTVGAAQKSESSLKGSIARRRPEKEGAPYGWEPYSEKIPRKSNF